jgi:uncharacterized protein
MEREALAEWRRAAVGIMARAPSSGGKTRLAPHLSESRLLVLRRALLADTLHVVSAVGGVAPFVFFTPLEGRDEIAAMACGAARSGPPSITLVPQHGDDLGARMQHALTHLLVERRFRIAVLVGSDIPLLTAAHLFEALDALRRDGGIVLGPADDGGYYLMGMTEVYPQVFDRIAWGGDDVLIETLARADRIGIGRRIIRGGYDVDTIEDLRRVEQDLRSQPSDVAPNLRAWLADSRQPTADSRQLPAIE